MMKKIISILLITIFCFGMISCNNSSHTGELRTAPYIPDEQEEIEDLNK